MKLGREKNGLVGSDVRPWHIRGTYRSFGKDGKVEYEGIYEEWWFSPTKYKLSFSGPHFTQTDFANGTTLMRAGEQEWPSGPETLLRESLIDPLPTQQIFDQFKLKRETSKEGKSKFDCVLMTYRISSDFSNMNSWYPSACFEQAQPGIERILSRQIIECYL